MTAHLDPVKRVLKEEARTWTFVVAVVIVVVLAHNFWEASQTDAFSSGHSPQIERTAR